MELKFLGRGSAFNVKEGNTSAYLKQDDMLLLIDCGESIFQRILEKNLLDDIKEVNVLITHLHSDHCGSLSSLIMYCFYCKGIKPNVYFIDRHSVINFLELTGAKLGVLWNELWLRNLWSKYKIDISVCDVKHTKEINSYGYYIIMKDTTVFYSGDTNEEETCWQFTEELDVTDIIYHDTCLADYEGNVHTSLRKLCKLVPKEYRNKVYCMHIDCNELIDKAKAEGFNVVEVE